jgi:hypothetical protein
LDKRKDYVEINLKRLFVLTLFSIFSALAGSSLTPEMKNQSDEINRLNSLINQQYGARAAEIDFAERQVALYHGCAFLFNVCKGDKIVAEKLINAGFTGLTSRWWWATFSGKLIGIAAAIGFFLWLPMHLLALFTSPGQERRDKEAAQKFISSLDEKVTDANRKRTQALQQASAMRRDLDRYASAVTECQNQLAGIEHAALVARANLNAAKIELIEVTRLKESFRQF